MQVGGSNDDKGCNVFVGAGGFERAFVITDSCVKFSVNCFALQLDRLEF